MKVRVVKVISVAMPNPGYRNFHPSMSNQTDFSIHPVTPLMALQARLEEIARAHGARFTPSSYLAPTKVVLDLTDKKGQSDVPTIIDPSEFRDQVVPFISVMNSTGKLIPFNVLKTSVRIDYLPTTTSPLSFQQPLDLIGGDLTIASPQLRRVSTLGVVEAVEIPKEYEIGVTSKYDALGASYNLERACKVYQIGKSAGNLSALMMHAPETNLKSASSSLIQYAPGIDIPRIGEIPPWINGNKQLVRFGEWDFNEYLCTSPTAMLSIETDIDISDDLINDLRSNYRRNLILCVSNNDLPDHQAVYGDGSQRYAEVKSWMPANWTVHDAWSRDVYSTEADRVYAMNYRIQSEFGMDQMIAPMYNFSSRRKKQINVFPLNDAFENTCNSVLESRYTERFPVVSEEWIMREDQVSPGTNSDIEFSVTVTARISKL